MLKGMLLSLFLTLAWIAAHLLIFHIRRPEKMFRVILSLFLPTAALFPALYLATPAALGFLPAAYCGTPVGLGMANGLLVHFLFFATYMEFFYYVTRAITLRILVELIERGGSAEIAAIQEEYNIGTMIAARLEAMEQNGFLYRDGERFLNTAKGRRYGRLCIASRRLLNVPE